MNSKLSDPGRTYPLLWWDQSPKTTLKTKRSQKSMIERGDNPSLCCIHKPGQVDTCCPHLIDKEPMEQWLNDSRLLVAAESVSWTQVYVLLVVYSPRGCQESDTTEWITLSLSIWSQSWGSDHKALTQVFKTSCWSPSSTVSGKHPPRWMGRGHMKEEEIGSRDRHQATSFTVYVTHSKNEPGSL